MVDDDDVALHGPAPHFRNKAAIEFAALLARTGICPRVQFVPEQARFRKLGKLGAVSGGGGLFPGCNGAILFDLFQSAQHGLIGQVI